MVELGHISEVRQRIADIQQQIGLPGTVPGMDFSKVFQKEVNKTEKQAKETRPVTSADSAMEAREAAAVQGGQKIGASDSGSAAPLSADPGSLSSMMEHAARKYQVDSRLVAAVAEVESDNDQSVISSAGAIGVMQLMPDTAAALGVDPYDTQQNIEGGTKYLRQMLDSFGGDVRKALAAYNAGPQAVRDYNGVPPYRETQNYVNKVLDIYR